MDELISSLIQKYPSLTFKKSDSYYWSPETNEIYYKDVKDTDVALWSVIHEVGHALLNHKSYDADYMLIRLEVDAWHKARQISSLFDITIDEEHIQDCFDTYRDWIFKRSICPKCTTKCLQQNNYKTYKCFNCHTTWRVAPSRFCRTYRATEKPNSAEKVFV